MRVLSYLTMTSVVALRCGGEAQVTTHLTKIYNVSVTNSANLKLVTTCAKTDVAPMIAFSASGGTHVVEEVVYDERKLSYAGPPNPPPDTAFWCSGGGESTHAMTGGFNKCLRVQGADPPRRSIGSKIAAKCEAMERAPATRSS